MKRLLTLASIALILGSCQSNNEIPEDVLPRETVKQILVEANKVEGALKANFILGDSAKLVAPTLYHEIYERHNTNAEEFKKSIDWYFEHPELLEEIQTEVVAKLLEEER